MKLMVLCVVLCKKPHTINAWNLLRFKLDSVCCHHYAIRIISQGRINSLLSSMIISGLYIKLNLYYKFSLYILNICFIF